MNNYNNWINNYPEINKLLKPIQNIEKINFNKLDENSCDHITNIILKKYGNDDKINDNQTKYLLDDIYKILGKNKSHEKIEINDFLNIHAYNKKFISKYDIKKSVNKQLSASKGLGINLNSKNVISKLYKLKELAKNNKEDENIERFAYEIFNKYNKDLNGYLDKNEMKNIIEDFYKDYNIEIDNKIKYFENYFINIDIDSNGKINFNEFCEYLKKIKDNKFNKNIKKID